MKSLDPAVQGNVKVIISMLSLRVPPLAGRSNPMQLIDFMGSPRRPKGLLAMTQWSFTDYDIALSRGPFGELRALQAAG